MADNTDSKGAETHSDHFKISFLGKTALLTSFTFFLIGSLLSSIYLVVAGVILMLLLFLSFSKAIEAKRAQITAIRNQERKRIFALQLVRIELQISNRGSFSLPLEFQDTLHSTALTKFGSNSLFSKVGPGKTAEYSYQVAFRKRGEACLGPLVVIWHCPLGFLSYSRTILREDKVKVYPTLPSKQHLQLRQARRVRRWIGEFISPLKGRSVNFLGHRDYLVGDEPKVLDWNATARLSRPIVKEFHRELQPGITVALFIGESMSGEKLEHGLRLFLALSRSLLWTAEMRLVTFSNKVESWSDYGRGTRHFLRFMEMTWNLRTVSLTKPWYMKRIAKRIGSNSFVIIIGDLEIGTQQIIHLVRLLRLIGCHVIFFELRTCRYINFLVDQPWDLQVSDMEDYSLKTKKTLSEVDRAHLLSLALRDRSEIEYAAKALSIQRILKGLAWIPLGPENDRMEDLIGPMILSGAL
ncbi:MAG: DUF58 domain-containing protein [Candidatus Hodarchaeales archaeon]|jgi:uncharacterized protein (DUF58 family)